MIDELEIEAVVDGFNDFADEIGGQAKVILGFNLDADPKERIVATLWPHGAPRSAADAPAVRAMGATFTETLQSLRDGWEEGKIKYREYKVRSLAVMIINITANKGSCSHEDLLKTGQFTEQELQEYELDGVTDANNLMAKGPFQIS